MLKITDYFLQATKYIRGFPRSLSDHNLRNSDFRVPRVKLLAGRTPAGFSFGPYLWSKLNITNRTEASLKRFKIVLRERT